MLFLTHGGYEYARFCEYGWSLVMVLLENEATDATLAIFRDLLPNFVLTQGEAFNSDPNFQRAFLKVSPFLFFFSCFLLLSHSFSILVHFMMAVAENGSHLWGGSHQVIAVGSC